MTQGQDDFDRERLRALLEDKELSVREAGRRMRPANPDAGRRALNRYLSGEVVPTLEKIAELADALEVAPTDLRRQP